MANKTEQELEADAADYVGVAAARRMAKQGYFKEQIARAAKAATAPAAPKSTHYEIRTLGGARLGEARTYKAAIEIASKLAPADYALEMYLVTDGKGHKIAERIRWNANERRRTWEDIS